MDESKLKRARDILAKCCLALDKNNWKYDLNEEELEIDFGAKGEDLPIRLIFRVDADREVVSLLSPLPFTVVADKVLDVAIGLSVINNRLVDGSFDFAVKEDSKVFFRMTQSYRDSIIGIDVFEYMTYCACHTIDDYNDKLLMLVKGTLSLEKFLDVISA